MTSLPTAVADVVDMLGAMPGVVAVVLGGSRAQGTHDTGADWDLGLYYRSTIDLTALSAIGTVHPPGSWGRIMNGGAWLTCGSERVDVLLRDLDTVDHWTRLANEGQFERDALLGYLAGIPTYVLCAELASCTTLVGELAIAPAFPARLAESAPHVWRFCRSFSLEYARAQARRGNVAGAVGQTATAAMEEGHAILCERGAWICNEKRLLSAAGLDAVHELFSRAPSEREALVAWVDEVAARLESAGRPSPHR